MSEWPDPRTVLSVPHQNKIISAFICDVYDGDTATAIIKFGSEFLKLKIRIIGIDTPEIRGGSELESKAARHVKSFVSSLILNKECPIKILNWDKYGARLDGEIYINSPDNPLSTVLLSRKYAIPYHGEKKKSWAASDLEYILLN